jgi:ATP-dependent Lon protease
VGVIGALLSDLSPGKPIRFRPTVVVGEPGGGKSRLVRRLCEELGLPFGTFDAASADDHGITGSARRWASGYPSLPVSTAERHRVANPAILVDEIGKAGRSSAGSVHDPLLALIERSTARAWRDHYLDAEVDVSHVSWLFTANALEGIPPSLRNCLRVLGMPRPGREHVPALAGFVLRDLLRERGIDPAWEPPLDGEETAAQVAAWGEAGSVRDLQRYVEAVLDARVHAATRNRGGAHAD